MSHENGGWMNSDQRDATTPHECFGLTEGSTHCGQCGWPLAWTTDADDDCCPFCMVALEAKRIFEDDYEYYCPECGYISHTD